MPNTKPPPVSAATITEFFKIAEFMQDKKAVSAALAQEAQEAAAKMEQARLLEREAAVRVEVLQRKANSLAKREAELHRREAAALDEEERLNKRRETPFAVCLRFGPVSGQFSDLGYWGLTAYTEKI